MDLLQHLQDDHSNDGVSTGDEIEEFGEEDFDDDVFNSDAEDETGDRRGKVKKQLQRDSGDKGFFIDGDRSKNGQGGASGDGTTLVRQVSDTSFDAAGSDEERAAFGSHDDHGEPLAKKKGGSTHRSSSSSLIPKEQEDSSCPFEIVQMTPRSKSKKSVKRN